MIQRTFRLEGLLNLAPPTPHCSEHFLISESRRTASLVHDCGATSVRMISAVGPNSVQGSAEWAGLDLTIPLDEMCVGS